MRDMSASSDAPAESSYNRHMAKMVPTHPLAFNSSDGEREVFEALRLLPDDVFVFHSLRWVGNPSRGLARAQGEADFVVFDPRRGLLVIEVKAGIIETAGRQWFQTNRATGERREIQDPEKQASTSKFRLVDEIRKFLSSGTCLVLHAVWFPSGLFSQPLPPNYAPEMVLDRADLERPADAIDAAFAYWESQPSMPKHRLGALGRDEVLRAIAPTLSLAVSMRSSVEEIDQRLVALTTEQARILDFLEDQDVALIGGPAGTGKTLLAVEQARRLASSGDRVLLVCYNAALHQYLEKNFATPRVEFATFHGLTRKLAPSAADDYLGLGIDFLLDQDVEVGFDHVLIDEGQDFEDDWVDALRLRQEMEPTRELSAGYPRFLLFYDPRQLVQQHRLPGWIADAPCKLVLRRNCRNTKEIGKTVGRLGALERYRLNEAGGAQPVLHLLRDSSAQGTVLDRLVADLEKERALRHHEIAILTTETVEASELTARGTVAGRPLSAAPAAEELLFTTVRRFKGLEAKAVILVDIDLTPPHDELWRNRLYVGSSRATHELHIMAQACSDESLKELTRELFPDRKKVRPSMKSVARKLNVKVKEETC